ncbi:MAG: hypothetical protein WBA57_04625 [Elainellaceae cyanobacterium]
MVLDLGAGDRPEALTANAEDCWAKVGKDRSCDLAWAIAGAKYPRFQPIR